MSVIHFSGLHSANPTKLAEAVLVAIKSRPDLSRISFTEVASQNFYNALSKIAMKQGWLLVNPQGPNNRFRHNVDDDCMMMINPTLVRVLAADYVELDPRKILNGRVNYALQVRLQDNSTNEIYTDFVIHFPAGVEDWDISKERVKIYASSLATLARKCRGLKFNILGDFNLDMNKPRNREIWKSSFQVFKVKIRFMFPKRGTLGKRAIDGAITNRMKFVRRLSKVQGYDHNPVIARL